MTTLQFPEVLNDSSNMCYSSGDDKEEYSGEVVEILCIGNETAFNLNIANTPQLYYHQGEGGGDCGLLRVHWCVYQ